MFNGLPVLASPPLKPAPVGADQLYVVPPGTIPFVTLAGVNVNVPPVHIVEDIPVIEADGLTVTVNVKVEPTQPLLLAVIK